MIVKVSPQGQVTIPKALRAALGNVRRMEARIERQCLVLRPVMADSVEDAVRQYGAEHAITIEVMQEALRVVHERRRAERRAAGDGHKAGS